MTKTGQTSFFPFSSSFLVDEDQNLIVLSLIVVGCLIPVREDDKALDGRASKGVGCLVLRLGRWGLSGGDVRIEVYEPAKWELIDVLDSEGIDVE